MKEGERAAQAAPPIKRHGHEVDDTNDNNHGHHETDTYSRRRTLTGVDL